MSYPINPRAQAALILARVIRNQCSLASLLTTLPVCQDPRDQALVQALVYGVCRYYEKLQALLKLLSPKPTKAKDQDVVALMLTGLYQLLEMRLPEYAAISASVAALATLKKNWAKGWVNAVLRQFQRDRDNLLMVVSQDKTAKLLHPTWLIDSIEQAWPAQAINIFQQNSKPPPLCLRVNQQKLTRASYRQKLLAEGIDAWDIPETSMGICLTQAVDVLQLPGFVTGEVSVQDGAAQLAADLLALVPGQRVLDVCAAPGGKTAHLLETVPDLEVVALDQDSRRLMRLKETLHRLQLKATCHCVNALAVSDWWDGQLFDRILLDAPCTGTGVIRRHPDIKLLRKPYDVSQLTALQLALLQAVWPLLKPGGIVLYVTCSILPAENEIIAQYFLQQQSHAKEEVIYASWGESRPVGRQLFPGGAMDGFYYARFRSLAN